MWPLLRREGLGLQYTVLTGLWAWLMGLHELPQSIFAKILHVGIYLGAVGLHIAELTVKGGIVDRLPDIWVVGNAVLCFGAFSAIYFWVLWRMVDDSGILEDVVAEDKERLKKME